MQFIISRNELIQLIRKIQNIVPQTAPVPILSHFLIEAEKDEVIVSATDLVVGIRSYAQAKIQEQGSISLPARRFFQLIRELPEANVEISTSGQMVEIVSGSSRFRLHGMDKSEYPVLPDLTQATQFSIPSNVLKSLLYRTAFAVSKEENRYVLTGVLMQVEQGRVIFVGTDGKRLAKTEATIQLDPEFSGSYILPLKAVDEIIKNLPEEESVTVYLTTDKIAVESSGGLIITKLLAGEYPNFQQVLSTEGGITLSLHREEMITLLRQIALFTPETSHSARFTFSAGELLLTANSAEIGEGKVSMPVNYTGETLEIAFNPHFFLDVLRHSLDETINLRISDAYSPGTLTDSTTSLFIIMPMRLENVAPSSYTYRSKSNI